MSIDKDKLAELFAGDEIQLDGGVHVVESVGNKTADCLPLGNPAGKVREVGNPFPRHLILERGKVGAVKAEKPKAKSGDLVTLELGDQLCFKNGVVTVFEVDDKHSMLGNLDGRVWRVGRRINEFYFNFTACGKPHCTLADRHTPEKRVEILKSFLATRQPPASATKKLPTGEPQPGGTETVSGETKNPAAESEQNMSKKSKSKKVKTARAKTERKPKVTNASPVKTATGVGKGNNNGGHKEKIYGHSVCAVLRALGSAGVTAAHATAILAARGVTMPAASLRVQVEFFGRNGQRPAAPLTKDEIKELKASAPEA